MAMERSLAAFSFALFASLASSIVLAVQAQQNPGFISIDCGAPNDYHDDQLDMYYKADAEFVDSGTNKQVSTQVINQQQPTLRIFPSGTRNCYTLRPDEGKGNTYLVRATFWYGDYDGKNQTPAFKLHIDVNYWITVDSSWISAEIIYTPLRDYIQVCLVNTGSGVPFISALELRFLSSSTYQIDSPALVTMSRLNLGSTDSYRHPEDVYDRIWTGETYSEVFSSVSNTTAIVTTPTNDAHEVPPEVLMTAVQTQNVTERLLLQWASDNSTIVWFTVLHFAELQLQENNIREFTVELNEFKRILMLKNLEPVTMASSPIGGLSLNLTISATDRSTLPPLLNAVEIFRTARLPNSPTFLDDFNAMYDVKKTYGVIKASWQGDPCIPTEYSWSGLNCSHDSSPRIVSLNLSSSGLTGPIATSISNLTAVTSLDLSNNSLTGLVPEFFSQMPSLKVLNLSGNNLNGSVPQTLLKKKADGSLLLSLDGNPNLSNVQPKKKGSSIAPIVASVGAALVLILLGPLAVLWIIKRRQIQRLAKLKSYKSGEISRIIKNARIIGEGAFGKVYLCTLDDGTRVAVKVLSKSSWQGRKEFQAELHLSIRAHHGNLVSLLGYCDCCKKMALVYEYMANGNLQEHLTGKKPNVLNWKERLQIALDVAHGLDYMHNGCNPPIIHRDLKTSNILLGENMVAKISDFGLSRDFTAKSGGYASSSPLGTAGYIAPECRQPSRSLNNKSDVYSFGIVLFELITGHPAMMQGGGSNSVDILDYVTSFIRNGNNMLGLMDWRLKGTFDIDSARKAIEIAESCTRKEPANRPDIGEVLTVLKALVPKKLALETKSEEGEPNEQLGMTSSEHEPDAAATAN